MFKTAVNMGWVMALGLLVALAQLVQPLSPRLAATESNATNCGCAPGCTCCLKPGAPAPITPPLSAPPVSAAQEVTWAIAGLVSTSALAPALLHPSAPPTASPAVPTAAKVAIFQRDCSFLI